MARWSSGHPRTIISRRQCRRSAAMLSVDQHLAVGWRHGAVRQRARNGIGSHAVPANFKAPNPPARVLLRGSELSGSPSGRGPLKRFAPAPGSGGRSEGRTSPPSSKRSSPANQWPERHSFRLPLGYRRGEAIRRMITRRGRTLRTRRSDWSRRFVARRGCRGRGRRGSPDRRSRSGCLPPPRRG